MDTGFDGGLDLKKLLQMVIPVVGGIAGDPAQQTGFQQGWQHGQSMAQQERERKQALALHQRDAGSRYTMDVFDKLNAIDNPDEFVQLRDLAAKHAPAGVNPGDFSAMQFPQEKLETKKRKAIADQLDALERGGYNLDDLSSAGTRIELKDGTSLPIGAAIDLTRKRPIGMDGQPVPKPAKADTNASTDYGRFLSRYARGKGKTVDTLTAAEELDARKTFNTVDDRPANGPAPGGVDAQFNDLVALWKEGHQGQEPPVAVRTQLRKQANQVNDKPASMSGMDTLYGQADPKAIGAAIMRGELPPNTERLGRPIGAAVESYLAGQGYNVSRAVTDWKATQRYLASRNSTPQLKLSQSINALPDLLDSVDALAAKWKGGRFPILNKANLALAKGGTYGPEVASIANQLDTQIADVISDLGVVYMGGNSPTDHALGLASKSLSGEWDQRVLHDMVKLAKSNVVIRRNSINNTGVAGASEDNPYAPPVVAPPTGGTRIFYDLNGNPVKR
jgi:hypothetical protein